MDYYTIWDVKKIIIPIQGFKGVFGAEWVVDGERGRCTYPPTMTEDEVREAYQKGE